MIIGFTRAALFAFLVSGPVSAASVEQDTGGIVDFGVAEPPAGPCITPEIRAAINLQAEAFYALQGEPDGSVQRGSGLDGVLKFFPMGGNLYSDIYLNNHVDLDPGSGILDRECSNHTYNGHDGHDIDIKTFAEQEIGVPIFAAIDGLCIARDDGHFDMNTVWKGQPGNFVLLDHGGGLRTLYFHMKNGSVLPSVGEHVSAGEQIGLIGSSGNSTGPHLHLELQVNGSPIEFSVGDCYSDVSAYETDDPIRRDFYLRDFGFHRGDITELHGGHPEPFLRDDQKLLSDVRMSYWAMGHNLPQNSTYRMRFFRPDGSLDFNSGTRSIGFSSSGFFRWFYIHWRWDIIEMRQIEGDWRVELDINGELVATAIVPVNSTLLPNLNDPPYQVGVELDPAEPVEGEAVFARIQTDLLDDDPEFDLVSYEYTWIVGDQVMRSVTSAGHADAIPIADNKAGELITVFVTPRDEHGAAGPATIMQATIAESSTVSVCDADCNADGTVNFADLVAMLFRFGSFGAGGCDADESGAVNFGDLVAGLFLFGPCPE